VNDTGTPYASLDPSLILNAIESLGFCCSGNLSALNSFENRVYQVGIEDASPLIAKFYRPKRWSDAAILEEHQFMLELAQHEIPVIAPIVTHGESLHYFQDFRFALFPRQGGKPLELDNLEHLEWMGRLIGRIHAVGACQSFEHRLHLNVQTYGYQPYQFLIERDFIPADVKHNYCYAMDQALQKITERFQEVDDVKSIRLHGDCHAGNVLWNHQGPIVVDFDDCLMGPAIQDIWMLLSGTPEEVKIQLKRILDGYQEFYDFDYAELELVEALRTLRMIHYAGWLAKRWEDPAFPLSFPWFNTPRYWQEQLQHINEQLPLI
jgi:Ser/Thr protein kinase RdoA (MazF antagonist)